MTLVLVHGNPETSAIWDLLTDELRRRGHGDVVALSPPGFGAPVPDGFDATSDAYRDWLIDELERIDGPIDLLGHDWGGGHAMRAATARPDLVRSLITDIAGTADRAYVWHDMALVWQTPGDGEAAVSAMADIPVADRRARLVAAGMTPAAAQACTDADPAAMGACILALYRSAVQPRMALWGEQFAECTDRPDTLVVVATEDHYVGGPDMARRVAQKWGARVAELDGVGHWWMMQDPAQGANAIGAFLDR